MREENNNTMYKCSICGKQYSTVVERAKCELACVKQLEEEKKKAAEVKKNAERDARKKEVTDAIEHANELVNKKIAIKQAKVMTRKGQLLGEATEFYIDEETGKITGIEVQIGSDVRIVRADHVITYGKELLIVHEHAQQELVSNVDALLSLKGTQVEPLIKQMLPETVGNELDELRQKQIEMLTGKRLLKDIVDANGQVLLPKDTVLTKEHVIRAQEEGPDVVIELSMNVE